MEPKEFCQRYAKLKEGERGYKSNWERLLAYCCRISVKTVRTWGTAPDFQDCPKEYRERLAEIDAMKAVEQVLKEHGLDQKSLELLE